MNTRTLALAMAPVAVPLAARAPDAGRLLQNQVLAR
jgi:hypothetical protein